MIYFITDTKNIKIGFTEQKIEKRLYQLQTSNANKLYILGWMHGDIDFEKSLHKQFGKYRIRHNGEWFKPSNELLEYINNHNEKEHTYVDIVGDIVMALLSIR